MQIPDYTEIYDGDRYCLMCRWACPVERVTKSEATSPHGWALLVASVRRGLATWNAETVDTLYKCADCGLCQANCATMRPLPYAIVAARASVVEQDAMPEAVRQLDAILRTQGSPYTPLDAEHESAPKSSKSQNPNSKIENGVGLYVGAASYAKNPGAVRAAERIMSAAGVSSELVDPDRSGVYLPYTLGLWDTARALARETRSDIERTGITRLVTLTKEDAHAFLHVYPELGLTLPKGLEVVPFADWLLAAVESGAIEVGGLDFSGAVFHDACHTPRLDGSWLVTRKLFTALGASAPGELFWRERTASPCGAVGGFEFTQPELARALAEGRLAEARKAGAGVIVTDDPLCAAHLAQYSDGIAVRSLPEIIWEQLAGK